MAVEAIQPLAGQPFGHRGETVGADDVEAGGIPEDEVVIVIVEGIEIPPLARAFPTARKGNLPQAPQLTQDHRVALLVAAIEQDALAVRGLAEQLAPVDGLFQQAAILRQGDGASVCNRPALPRAIR